MTSFLKWACIFQVLIVPFAMRPQKLETMFSYPISYYFWTDLTLNILKNIRSCHGLLLQDVIIGILKEEMDLVD